MNHTLKTHPAVFRAVRDGTKTFEVRKDDRAFQCGDTIMLIYHDPETRVGFPMPPRPHDPNDDQTPINARVGFVLRGGQYGIEPGYVAFSLFDVRQGP
jgi:hypothetical protein